MKHYYLSILSTFLLVIYGQIIHGQDIHYSQFYNTPMNVNPALTGVFNGDHRFILSHRDQWRFVPVPWTTFSGSWDMVHTPFGSEKVFYGLGLQGNYDRQGDSRLNLLGLNLNGALHFVAHPHHILSLGLNIGFNNRGFDMRSLRWDRQWNGETFDTSLPSNESFQNTERISFIETGVGGNYRYQKSQRTYLNIGMGVHHLVEPNVSFAGEDDVKLPRRYSIIGEGNFQVHNHFDIQVHALHQLQRVYQETVLGVLGKIHVNQQRGKETEVHFGLGYRTSGSFIPTLAFKYQEWYLGMNLDLDRTDFNQRFNTNRGAYELHLQYIIKNVKSFRAKNCHIL